jgi:hypothetical protein
MRAQQNIRYAVKTLKRTICEDNFGKQCLMVHGISGRGKVKLTLGGDRGRGVQDLMTMIELAIISNH